LTSFFSRSTSQFPPFFMGVTCYLNIFLKLFNNTFPLEQSLCYSWLLDISFYGVNYSHGEYFNSERRPRVTLTNSSLVSIELRICLSLSFSFISWSSFLFCFISLIWAMHFFMRTTYNTIKRIPNIREIKYWYN